MHPLGAVGVAFRVLAGICRYLYGRYLPGGRHHRHHYDVFGRKFSICDDSRAASGHQRGYFPATLQAAVWDMVLPAAG